MTDIVERLRSADVLIVKSATDLRSVVAEEAADEIEKLRDAINAALTENTPMDGGLWSQEPIGPNETPAEAIKRLIKFRVYAGCIVERDTLKAENEKLRAALRAIAEDCEADYPPSHGAIKYAARAALGEKE